MRKQAFGRTLKRLRKEGGLSQDALSKLVGVHVTYVSKIENGKIEIMPSRDLIEKLEAELFVDKGYLLDLAGYYDPKRLDEAIEENPYIARHIRELYEKE